MPTVFAFTPWFKDFDNNGNLGDGLQVFTFAAGTAPATKQSSYTDSTGNSANTNPKVLDSRGEMGLWLDTSLLYDIWLCSATEPDPPVNNIKSVANFGFAQSISQTSFTTTALSMLSANVPMGNGYMTASANVNAITIALKTLAGTDPTAADKITVVLRDATITDGSLDPYNVTAALSTVISSGSTLGCGSSEKVRIHVGAMRNASTGIELFYWTGMVASSASIKRFDPTELITTTAEGGAGGADSAQTAYSTTARTSQPWIYLGYIEATSGATAGQWSSIDKIVSWQPGLPMPGDMVNYAISRDSAVATGSGLIPYDDSIPQSTEGDQYMSQAITPKSAMNMLIITHIGCYSINTAAANSFTIALFQDTTANALAAIGNPLSQIVAVNGILIHRMRAGTASSTTFKIRAAINNSGTITFNGVNAARIYAGISAGTLMVQEFMA